MFKILVVHCEKMFLCECTEEQFMAVLYGDDRRRTKARALMAIGKPWESTAIHGFHGAVVVVEEGM